MALTLSQMLAIRYSPPVPILWPTNITMSTITSLNGPHRNGSFDERMVAEFAKIQDNETQRPVTTLRQIPRNNEFTQSRTSKPTDSTTHRSRPYQQAPPQNTKKRYAILPAIHMRTSNQRHPPPHIHLPKIDSRKISPHSENRQERFLYLQTIHRQEYHPPHAHLPQENWTFQAYLRRYCTSLRETFETLAQHTLLSSNCSQHTNYYSTTTTNALADHV